MGRLEKARDFFLEKPTYSVRTVGMERITCTEGINGDLKILLDELNKYIYRNKGTTDFSIIQNKTERFAHTIYENATSNLAFPTYMGLMGTFIGVFMGLIGFVLPDLLREFGLNIDSSEESNITRLVYGVIVSMITSFMGLYYTTKSNRVATEVKRTLDERKNIFYDFIQNELMPVLGMSVVHALTQLRETLLNFHTQFDIITNKFQTTFDSCTEKFGKEFKKNIDAVSNAAEKLGSSIEAVNKNVENQKELLQELRAQGMMTALDSFINAGKQFKDSADALRNLNEVRNQLNKSVQELMTVQKDYSTSLVVPKLIAERLNVILTRITTFEESINALGTNIAVTQMLGNSEMHLIEEHLADIKRKDAIAAEYQETANEELKKLFDTETETIRSLHRQYTSAIETHGDEFRVLMDLIADAIQTKKTEFIERLESAFDIADLKTEFAQLNRLPEIQEKISTINQTVDNFHNTVKEQSNAEIIKLGVVESKVTELKTAIENTAEKSMSNTNAFHSELKQEIISATEKIDSSKESIIDSVKENQQKIEESNKEYIKNISELNSKIEHILVSVNEIQKDSQDIYHIDAETLNAFENSIKNQITELSTLNGMVEQLKNNINGDFSTLIDQKLKDITERVDSINTIINIIKDNADKE